MVNLWTQIFYRPLYNALVGLIDILPNHSLFFAVVLLTILVRLLLAPLSYKAIRTQLKTQTLQPKLKEIKKIPDKQEQARKTVELYKENGVNPFSSFLLILAQLPIIIALYSVFKDGGVVIDPSLLYPFVTFPETINKVSFGIDLTQKSYILALLVGVTQYIYLALVQGRTNQNVQDKDDMNDQEKMMQGLQKSMQFTMPVMVTVFAYVTGGAVALYWLTSNIFMIVQEQLIQRQLERKPIESLAKPKKNEDGFEGDNEDVDDNGDTVVL